MAEHVGLATVGMVTVGMATVGQPSKASKLGSAQTFTSSPLRMTFEIYTNFIRNNYVEKSHALSWGRIRTQMFCMASSGHVLQQWWYMVYSGGVVRGAVTILKPTQLQILLGLSIAEALERMPATNPQELTVMTLCFSYPCTAYLMHNQLKYCSTI